MIKYNFYPIKSVIINYYFGIGNPNFDSGIYSKK